VKPNWGSSDFAVGGDINNPAVGEALMTIESLWTPPLVAGKDGSKQSFWHWWVTGITASRQKKADEVVKEYLQRQAENRALDKT
jgi:hypothetical protein